MNTTKFFSELPEGFLPSILAQVLPDPKGGIRHPGNWPADAVLGVLYKVHDRQFPQVVHEPTTVYFASQEEYDAWLASKLEWIKGTDYDFSLEGRLFKWDLGPEFIEMINL